jgi:hypothetical protein
MLENGDCKDIHRIDVLLTKYIDGGTFRRAARPLRCLLPSTGVVLGFSDHIRSTVDR